MKIVVDTNILFSFFWKESITRRILMSSPFELISSEFSLLEIMRYNDYLKSKTKLSDKKFNNFYEELKNTIKFMQKNYYQEFIKEALKISPDKDDAEFLALCIKEKCILWSNDSLLKNQNKVKVVNTEELINLLF